MPYGSSTARMKALQSLAIAWDNSISFAVRSSALRNWILNSPGVSAMAAGRDLAPGPLQLLHEAGAAARFPLVDPTSSGGFHPIDERGPRDGGGVADPDAGQPGHQLPGAAFPDAEESLDGLAVQVAGVHAAEHLQNFRKPVKPGGLGRHRAGFDSTTGQGAIRHYGIVGRPGAGVEYE